MNKPVFLPQAAAPLVALLLCLVSGTPSMASPTDAIDRILIVVNDEVITAREVDERIAAVRQRLAAQNTATPPDALLRRQVMERLAIERLQLQAAAERGLRVTDSQLDTAIGKIAEQNGKTPDQLKREAEKEPGGYRAFRAEIRAQILMQQLIDREVRNRVTVSDAEVDQFLANQSASEAQEQFDLSHILIAVPEKATPEAIDEARRKAESLHAELERGTNFAQLAVAQSQGQNALEGGGLGWRAAGELPDLFLNAVRSLQPGEISPVLRSPSGFHLLRLNGRRGSGGAVNVTQTHVRHILIKPSELLPPREAQRRASLLRERLLAGEDFAQAARTHSEDLGSAANGGDLGWMNPGQLVPEFEKAMNGLKPGEISEPVQSSFGFHIIQVLERREHDVSRERQHTQARNQILARKTEERYEQWLRQLRDEAYVEFRLDPAP